MDILDKIVEHTKGVVAARQQQTPRTDLERRITQNARDTISLTKCFALNGPQIIAEFKRKSPSRPSINLEADPRTVAQAYEAGGAAAMSVLTEPAFFAGDPADLEAVRPLINLPILRKDFMIDPYQFYEARAMGADLILLIARVLEPAQINEFTALAHELGMEALLEIHDLDELEGVTELDMLGVNCRDLKRFVTNLDLLVELAPRLPRGVPLVAESGIHGPADLHRLYDAGYRGFLIGEHLMKSGDPTARLKEFLHDQG